MECKSMYSFLFGMVMTLCVVEIAKWDGSSGSTTNVIHVRYKEPAQKHTKSVEVQSAPCPQPKQCPPCKRSPEKPCAPCASCPEVPKAENHTNSHSKTQWAFGKPNQLCLAIVASQGVKTLEQTLSTYERSGLLDIADRVVLMYSALGTRDAAVECWIENLTEKYGIVLLSSDNVYHGRAFRRAAMACIGIEYFMFLEEDFKIENNLLGKKDYIHTALYDGIRILRANAAQLVAYRSPWEPGEPNWERYDTKKFHVPGPEGMLKAHTVVVSQWAYNTDDPTKYYTPDILWHCGGGTQMKWFCTNSSRSRLFFSNNPHLYNWKYWVDHFRVWTYPDRHIHGIELGGTYCPEWQLKGFNLAFGRGIFTHERLDRSHTFDGRDECAKRQWRPPTEFWQAHLPKGVQSHADVWLNWLRNNPISYERPK